ncbi:hypothetical protein NS183_17140, partial [Microbacterium testaceum]
MPSTVASAPPPLTDPSIDVVVDSHRARRLTMPFAALALAAVVTTVSLSPVGTAAFIDAPLDLRAVLVALFRVDDLRLLPFIVAAILLIGAGAERMMGARRVLLAYIGGGVAISVLGLAIGVVETSFLPALPLNSPPFEGAPPIAALLAVTMASSCFAGALWRRRVRLASVFVALTLFLYSASASDLYALVALPVGLAIGMLAGGRRARLRVQRSSHHETRVLLSALTAVTAIGPVIATVWGSGAGLLSVYGWLSMDPLTSADGIVCVGSSALPCPSAENYAELQPLAGWIAILPLAILLVASWGILRGRRGALSLAIAMNLLVFAGVAYLFAVTEPSTLADLAA